MNYIDELAMGIMRQPYQEEHPLLLPLYRYAAVLCLAKGAEVTAEDAHNAFVAWALSNLSEFPMVSGPAHPLVQSYRSLPPPVQEIAKRLAESIRKAARERGITDEASIPEGYEDHEDEYGRARDAMRAWDMRDH